jgi:small GTP-binding protein
MLQTTQFRVVTIGDASVGKTSIISQLLSGQFTEDQCSTIGAMFVLHVEIIGNLRVEMQVWDTAGQERYRSLGPIYYRNAAAAIVVFDLTNLDSFDRLENWITDFLNNAGDRALICVVGNKVDLVESFAVSEERIKQWIDEHQFLYIRTSAKTGQGVRDLFRLVAATLMEGQAKWSCSEIGSPSEKVEKSGCC